MKNIEKLLKNYVRGTGTKPTTKELVQVDSEELIDSIFDIVNEELDSIGENKSLEPEREVLNFICIALGTSNDIDRDFIIRRLHKLDLKLDRVKIENKNKIKNQKKLNHELEGLREEIEKIEIQVNEKENKQYHFMNYLIEEVRNITYLEYTFEKFPNFLYLKDKNDISLFQTITSRYLKSIEKCDWENSFYYNNVLSLFFSEKTFELSDKEKKDILNNFCHTINRLSKNKEDEKKYKTSLTEMKNLVNVIKENHSEKTDDIEQIGKKYNVAVFFDSRIMEDIKRLKISKKNRIEVKDYTITIDGEGVVEIDDALSCGKLENGNYLLGVHIASVLGYYPYGSKIVEEAIERDRSIYLPRKYQVKENDYERVIPLFPYDFSANRASLVEGLPRLTRSYYFELNPDGSIVHEDFFKTVTTSNKKTSFTEIDEILSHGSSNKQLQETVFNLQKVAEILDKRYRPSTLYEEMKEKSPDYSDLKVKRIGAEKIVYQAMLLTGNRVAEYFADSKREYPFLYRVHEFQKDHMDEIQKLLKDLSKTYGGEQYQKLYQLINGMYPKGWYDKKGRHEGLRINHHCHCTSNLRRGADIVVEHALEVCYDKIPTDKDLLLLENDIEKRISQINAKENTIDWFLRDYKRSYQKRR